MRHNEEWMHECIEAAKDLEYDLDEEKHPLLDAVSSYTDFYYPQDVVKEILLDGNGTINGEVPPLSELNKEYYYCQSINGDYTFCDVKEEHVKLLEQNLLNLKFWIPHREGCNVPCFFRYQAGEYKDHPLYFMDIPLSADVQSWLIGKFQQWYGDTDQDTEQFGAEFYIVISGILDGMLALNPQYLLIEDVLEEYVDMLPEKIRDLYIEGIRYTRDGCRPVPCSEKGKKVGFYIVLMKKNWIRNMEVYLGKKQSMCESENQWRSVTLAGYLGFYLAECQKEACRYAKEDHGYPVESLVAIDVSRILSGDFRYLRCVKDI